LEKSRVDVSIAQASWRVCLKVVIRTDASLRIGTGHVMRCLTLAKALVEKGVEVSFICREHQGNLINKIEIEGFKVYSLTTIKNTQPEPSETSIEPQLAHSEWLGVSQQQDASDCRSILDRIQPDWLIVDHYALDKHWQEALKPYYKKLMVIDDLGDREHLCDLLLDQNYGATAAKYQHLVPSHCQILAGTDYSLLRPEFARWRDYSLNRRKDNNTVENILITMGGVDPDNYTGKILTQIGKVPLAEKAKIIIVMGATAPHLQTVQQQAAAMPFDIEIKTNVTNMAEIMANADLAIGAAGSTTWERCCLGLPTIQLVIAENQRKIALTLANDSVVKLMDDVEQLPGLVQSSSQWQAATSLKSSRLTDGLGCKSVVNELLEKVK
jgi:UDP-2,4-diacetamido-2,4,6-trideoxy-beta-L-altropyranose hydrolase